MKHITKILGRDIKEEKDTPKKIVMHEGYWKKREISLEQFDNIFFFSDSDLRKFFCDSTTEQKVNYEFEKESEFSPYSLRSTTIYTFKGRLKRDKDISVKWSYIVRSYGDDNPLISYNLSFRGKNKKTIGLPVHGDDMYREILRDIKEPLPHDPASAVEFKKKLLPFLEKHKR